MKVCALDIERTQIDRCELYLDIIKQLESSNLDCLIFPGGFFEGKDRNRFVQYLKRNPPGIVVIIGWDKMLWKNKEKCKDKKKRKLKKDGEREVWAVSPSGKIGKSIPEAWVSSGKYNKNTLAQITERRCCLEKVDVDLYCCGDILIRTERIFQGDFAAVAAHQSPTGWWIPAMSRLKKPVFLSYFVNNPHDNNGMAYKKRKPIPLECKIESCSFGSNKWKVRIYKIEKLFGYKLGDASEV